MITNPNFRFLPKKCELFRSCNCRLQECNPRKDRLRSQSCQSRSAALALWKGRLFEIRQSGLSHFYSSPLFICEIFDYKQLSSKSNYYFTFRRLLSTPHGRIVNTEKSCSIDELHSAHIAVEYIEFFLVYMTLLDYLVV